MGRVQGRVRRGGGYREDHTMDGAAPESARALSEAMRVAR